MRCRPCRKNFSYNRLEYLKHRQRERSALLQTVIVFQIIFERSAEELLSVLGLVGESDLDKGIKIFVVPVRTVRSATC